MKNIILISLALAVATLSSCAFGKPKVGVEVPYIVVSIPIENNIKKEK